MLQSRLRRNQRFYGLVILVMCLSMFTSLVTATDTEKPSSSDIPEAGTADVVAEGDLTANLIYNVPVDLSEMELVSSPTVDASAPYTPVVLSLIAQLQPTDDSDEAQIEAYTNIVKLLTNGGATNLGGGVEGCWGTGPVGLPIGTTPSIEQICWADAQGILMTSGDLTATGTTAPMTLIGLGSTFDRDLANVWGQTEAAEARWYMITGIYGPQGDIAITPNWSRNLTSTGEDSFLSYELVAAQVDGMQGTGTMSQMKHYAVYNGQSGNTTYQDQWLHEIGLAPYEGGYVAGLAAASMCSYQASQNLSEYLDFTVSSVWPRSPFSDGEELETWPLDEMHYACEQPLLLNYVLRQQWGSLAHVATDYGAIKSASAIVQGTDQEMPTKNFFGSTDPYGVPAAMFGPNGFDLTGSTCADPATGEQVDCSVEGAVYVSGIPGDNENCELDEEGGGGCGLVTATAYDLLPVSLMYQSLARILYQQERFGLLGCSDADNTTCTNPGGNGGNTGDVPGEGTRTGQILLAEGSAAAMELGTISTDAAIVEKMSEEGAVLLKNDGDILPISASDLEGSILITGSSANYTIADPTGEASVGLSWRNAINPLQQIKAFTGKEDAFTFIPANNPTGFPVPASTMFSTEDTSVSGSLNLTINGEAAEATADNIDYTTASALGQLDANTTYTWSGYLYVPTADDYTLRLQYSDNPDVTVSFAYDGAEQDLFNSELVYGGGGWQGQNSPSNIQSSPTTAGYTEGGLLNKRMNCEETTETNILGTEYTVTTCTPYTLSADTYVPISITFDNASDSPASFRFAYSRAEGDYDDLAAAAADKAMAIVFVTDQGATSTIESEDGAISAVYALSDANTRLIETVSAANPNTVVVLNTSNPVLMPWIDDVKAVLNMWFAGQEGGTSTARLLLGLANPSGHTAITWPANETDTIWAYDQTDPLYEGDTTGVHLERYGTDEETSFTQGIYSGYRYFDQMGIEPLFVFGHGLSYTQFEFSDPSYENTSDGGVDVTFTLANVGERSGADVVQIYVGPPADSDTLAGVQFAVRALAQFERIELAAGESQTITLHIAPRQLSYWSEAQQAWILDAAGRALYVGDSSAEENLTLVDTISVPEQTEFVCENAEINSTLIEGDLIVPEGAWCDLVNVTVTGSINATGSSGIRLMSSVVEGDFTASATAGAENPHSSGSNTISYSTIGGDVTVTGSTSASPWMIGNMGENSIGGNVTFSANEATGNSIAYSAITGDLNCESNGSVQVLSTTATNATNQCEVSE